jgi:hypothetical protein
LAAEVREGHAAVAPRDVVKTCRPCGLQSLCRIGSVATDANDGNGDV